MPKGTVMDPPPVPGGAPPGRDGVIGTGRRSGRSTRPSWKRTAMMGGVNGAAGRGRGESAPPPQRTGANFAQGGSARPYNKRRHSTSDGSDGEAGSGDTSRAPHAKRPPTGCGGGTTGGSAGAQGGPRPNCSAGSHGAAGGGHTAAKSKGGVALRAASTTRRQPKSQAARRLPMDSQQPSGGATTERDASQAHSCASAAASGRRVAGGGDAEMGGAGREASAEQDHLSRANTPKNKGGAAGADGADGGGAAGADGADGGAPTGSANPGGGVGVGDGEGGEGGGGAGDVAARERQDGGGSAEEAEGEKGKKKRKKKEKARATSEVPTNQQVEDSHKERVKGSPILWTEEKAAAVRSLVTMEALRGQKNLGKQDFINPLVVALNKLKAFGGKEAVTKKQLVDHLKRMLEYETSSDTLEKRMRVWFLHCRKSLPPGNVFEAAAERVSRRQGA